MVDTDLSAGSHVFVNGSIFKNLEARSAGGEELEAWGVPRHSPSII
jgi:hypothetical protein